MSYNPITQRRTHNSMSDRTKFKVLEFGGQDRLDVLWIRREVNRLSDNIALEGRHYPSKMFTGDSLSFCKEIGEQLLSIGCLELLQMRPSEETRYWVPWWVLAAELTSFRYDHSRSVCNREVVLEDVQAFCILVKTITMTLYAARAARPTRLYRRYVCIVAVTTSSVSTS